jgi:dihydropyrimidinase
MCPPLRAASDREALLKALEKEIDVIATDHCSFLFENQKMAGKNDFTLCPSGAPGVAERIPLLYNQVSNGRISLRRFTDLCCANPARLFGVYPQKGVIAAGSDADFAVIDPEKRVTITKEILRGNADYSAYEGMTVKGWPDTVISRGCVIARNGEFIGKAGRGKFLKRKLYSEPR